MMVEEHPEPNAALTYTNLLILKQEEMLLWTPMVQMCHVPSF